MINAGNQTRMDWFKSILHSLPLEAISDILGEIAIWWGQLVKDVPAADLPMYAYLGGVIIVLILWLLVARVLPRPLGGMSWMMLFAVLLAPGTALGDPSVIAPASISVITREDLDRKPAQNLKDILQEVPGVQLTNEGDNRRGVSIRGLDSSYTLIFLNSMALWRKILKLLNLHQIQLKS